MSAAMGSLARFGGPEPEEREFGSPGERMKGIGSACSWSLPHRNEERKRMSGELGRRAAGGLMAFTSASAARL